MKEAFWKWEVRISALMGIYLFWKSWGENMSIDSMKLIWDKLTPVQFLFFSVLLFVFVSFWRWRLAIKKDKEEREIYLQKYQQVSNKPPNIIRNPEGYYYLIEGNNCLHIPDKPTLEYLGSYFGFKWSDAKTMLDDEIKQKFVIGKQLPSITLHCPTQDK